MAASIPLIENIVMLEHASSFSFDRLKFILPASIIIAVCLTNIGAKARALSIFFLVLISAHSFYSYKNYMRSFDSWRVVDQKNRALNDLINKDAHSGCATYGSNLSVRGYENLLFHRGIYENITQPELEKMVHLRNSCAGVFIEGEAGNLPIYKSATITYADGSVKVLTAAR